MKSTFAHGKASSLSPVINVTPLVDVVLVLLIIFMVVLPSMQDDGKPIEMVKVERADDGDPEAPEPVVVTIDSAEHYLLEDLEMSRVAMLDHLRAKVAAQPGRGITMRADASLRYQVVRDLFRELQEMGFKGIGLAVGTAREWKPEPEGS